MKKIIALAAFLIASVTAAAAEFLKNSVAVLDDGTYLAEAEVIMDASPAAVRHAILTVCESPEYRKLFPYCRVFKVEGLTAWVHEDVPVPMLWRRDFVLKRTVEEDFDDRGLGTFRLSWVSDEEGGPPPLARHVRVHVNDGSWVVRPAGDGTRAHSVYTLHCEGGGNVPPWMAALAARETLPEYMRTVEAVAKRADREIGPRLKER